MALNQENAKNAPFRRNRPRKRGSCKRYNEAAVEPEVMSSLPGQVWFRLFAYRRL